MRFIWPMSQVLMSRFSVPKVGTFVLYHVYGARLAFDRLNGREFKEELTLVVSVSITIV